jgi:hypothetical protein
VNDPLLLITAPPHPGPVDAEVVAARLGLTVIEARARIANPLPDPWLLFDDDGDARLELETLAGAGVAADLQPASALAAVPAPVEATSFRLEEDGLGWPAAGGEAWLPFAGVRLLATCHRERIAGTKRDLLPDARETTLRRMSSMGGAFGAIAGGVADDLAEMRLAGTSVMETVATFEIAGLGVAGPARVRLHKHSLRYHGMGRHMQPTAERNWAELQRLVAARCGVAVDRRAEKAAPRPLLVGRAGLVTLIGDLSPRLRAMASDPLDFVVTVGCARAGV